MGERIEAVTARYRDRDHASEAVERLSLVGVEAGRIRLLTPPADGGRRTQRAADAGAVRRVGRRLGIGALLGAVLGAVVGAVVVALATGTGAGGALAGAVAGAAVGAGIGALAGAQSTPTMSHAWEATLSPDDASAVTVAVEIRGGAGAGSHHDPAEIEEILAATGGRAIHRVRDLTAAEEALAAWWDGAG